MAEDVPWWEQTDPGTMIYLVGPRLKPRKLRLIACACCRATGLLDVEPKLRAALEVAELAADQPVEPSVLQAARASTALATRDTALLWLAEAVSFALGDFAKDAWNAAEAMAYAARSARDAAGQSDWADARKVQADLLRDLAHAPKPLPAIKRAWRAWNNGSVPKLAWAIYTDHSFGDLPVLADALEEAGCDNADLLGHCRSPLPHARGCWALDAVLGVRSDRLPKM
jgi:hypothetical protein